MVLYGKNDHDDGDEELMETRLSRQNYRSTSRYIFMFQNHPFGVITSIEDHQL
ncbi:hypothetical protein DERF_004581 [Dermatophagoides farinae]|uniref:Uncharacterized protein n=1 Tax=Dermatophagoides farinae TaxID=6954 RepID=A0A922LA94_DERFA|nr:hypothetical protein DERF_004581 [Dermatophagoides farinae]